MQDEKPTKPLTNEPEVSPEDIPATSETELPSDTPPVQDTPPKPQKHLSKRKKILLIVGGATIVIGILFGVPVTRWAILNTVGLRSTVQLNVTEQAASEPVTNAKVTLGTKTATTDTLGHASFSKVRLGSHPVRIEKSGYAPSDSKVTVSLGTKTASVALKATGVKLGFVVKDWLSNQPISSARITYLKDSALSNQTGQVVVVVPPSNQGTIALQVTADGYITKTVTVALEAKTTNVQLVSSQKDYFISKRAGTYDIYSSNLDRTDQEKIIDATGKEDASLLQLTVTRDNKQGILVATREGKRVNNRIVAGVYAVDFEKASIRKFDEGSDVQLLDWGDNTIAYTKTSADLDYKDANLTKLMTYNTATNKLSQQVQANYFPTTIVAQNKLFYMPGDAYQPIVNAIFTSVDLTSGAKKTYLAGQQVFSSQRSSYDTLQLQAADKYYELTLKTGAVKSIDSSAATGLSFALSPDSNQVAWTEQRDGQGVLLTKNFKDAKDSTVAQKSAWTNPLHWVSNSLIVVRAADNQETADYIVHVGTGKYAKIVDVSNVGIYRGY